MGGGSFVEEWSGWSYFFMVNGFEGTGGGQAGLASYWDTYTDVQQHLSGGDMIHNNLLNQTAWLDSIPTNLATIFVRFSPLDEFVAAWVRFLFCFL